MKARTQRTQRKDRKGQAKHEPDFHFGLRKKREFALFFFRARRFRFFSRSFFFALFFSLRARERESAKKAPAPTSDTHVIIREIGHTLAARIMKYNTTTTYNILRSKDRHMYRPDFSDEQNEWFRILGGYCDLLKHFSEHVYCRTVRSKKFSGGPGTAGYSLEFSL
jgi:hypothetical protein